MNDIVLTNIQRFSLNDGPGIRTTVFLKGCSLRCPWCSNPENLSSDIQAYIKDGKKGTYGVYYTPERLYDEVIKDKAFYVGDVESYNIADSSQIEGLPGGVTFSGGECLLQMNQMEPLLKRLNDESIHTAAETCLFVPSSDLEIAIKYIDFFYVDIKILDEKRCRELLCGKLDLFLENLFRLMDSKRPVVLRLPVISGFTDDENNRNRVADLIRNLLNCGNVLKIELIKEHNLGLHKYKSLIEGNNDIVLPIYKGVSDKLMKQYQKEIMGITSIPVEICKI